MMAKAEHRLMFALLSACWIWGDRTRAHCSLSDRDAAPPAACAEQPCILAVYAAPLWVAVSASISLTC